MADDTARTGNRRQWALIATGVIGGAILLSLLWYVFVRTSFAPAFTGLESGDANTIVEELQRLKTPYKLADNGATVLVPEDRIDETRIKVLGGELPLKGAVGFELFNKTDMGLTEFAQKINYQRALQGELARTIMSMEEFDSARVHLSIPDSGIFQEDRRPAKASVTLTTKLGGTPEAGVVRGIQQLVASAVAELEAANVAVLDARGQLLSAVPVAPLIQSPQQQQRLAFEQLYAGKIRQAIEGAGLAMPINVTVAAMQSFEGMGGPDEPAGEPPVRKGALRATIMLAAEPGPAIRERMLGAARTAMGFDSGLGDVLDVQIDPALGAAPPPSPVRRMARPEAQPAPAFDLARLPLWPFAVALGVLLALFAAVRLRRNAAEPVDREAFADRLKSLLEEESRNGRASA